MRRLLVQRIRNSHHTGATHEANFGFESCTSQLLSVVWYLNLKFLHRVCHPWDRNFKFTTLAGAALAALVPCYALAQDPNAGAAGGTVVLPEIDVVATSPVGADIAADKVPAAVRTLTAAGWVDVDETGTRYSVGLRALRSLS